MEFHSLNVEHDEDSQMRNLLTVSLILGASTLPLYYAKAASCPNTKSVVSKAIYATSKDTVECAGDLATTDECGNPVPATPEKCPEFVDWRYYYGCSQANEETSCNDVGNDIKVLRQYYFCNENDQCTPGTAVILEHGLGTATVPCE